VARKNGHLFIVSRHYDLYGASLAPDLEAIDEQLLITSSSSLSA